MSTGPTPPETIGRYVVTGVLGRGNFAIVYRGVDPALDTPVAIKVLAEHHATDPDVRARFIEEARTLRRLDSDQVVRVHDIGEHDGQPFFVMPVLDGGSLADRLGPPHAPSTVAHLVRQIAACLRVVHDAGLVHRDIKPSNLLIRSVPDRLPRHPGRDVEGEAPLGPGEQIVLADFGLVRRVDATALTIAGGTVGYMAPEQLTPVSDVDARADLHAASVIIWQALRGTDEPLPAGHERNPLAREIREGTAADRNRRPPDVDAWEQRLLAILSTAVDSTPTSSARSRAARAQASDTVRIGTSDPPAPPRADVVVAAGDGGVARAPAISSSSSSSSDVRLRPVRVGVLVGALVLLAIVGALSVNSIRGGDAGSAEPSGTTADVGPRIIGPMTLLIGESGTYVHEDRPASSFTWELSDGTTSDAPAVTVTPPDLAPLSVTLTEEVDGVESMTTMQIEVRDR